MKKKSRHRLNEMKENEAKRKNAEVGTTTLSGLPVFGKTLECIKDRHGLLQDQHNDTGLFIDTRAFTPSAGEPFHTYIYRRCSRTFTEENYHEI
jgi:hypothetical protein